MMTPPITRRPLASGSHPLSARTRPSAPLRPRSLGSRTLKAAALSLALALTSACNPPPPVQRSAGTDLTRPLATRYEDPGLGDRAIPESQKQEIERLSALMDKFFGEREALMKNPETERYLDQLEQWARWTSRYLELVNVYREAFDASGPGHFSAPRLVLGYINLGQPRQARLILDQVREARPDDARAHFLHGYLLSFEGPINDARGREVGRNWARAIEIDPDLKYLYPISAKVIKERLAEIERTFGKLSTADPARAADPAKAPDPSTEPVAADTPPADAPPPDAPPAEITEIEKEILQAESLLASGVTNAAYPAFQRILAVEPNNSRALYGRAMAGWQAIGAYERDKAIGLLNAVALRDDLTSNQMYELGTLYFKEVKDTPKALALWQKLLTRDPAFAEKVRLADVIERVSKSP